MNRVISTSGWTPRRVRLTAAGTLGVCLVSASVAYAGASSASGTSTQPARAARSPLSAHAISTRMLHGRITGAVTITDRGDTAVRATTAVLALAHGARGEATGVVSLRVAGLAAGRSVRIHFTSRRLGAIPVPAGSYRSLVCTDVDGQLGRFARSTNCSSGPSLLLPAGDHAQPSGPSPRTIIERRPPRRGSSSRAVLRFRSNLAHSTFQCRLGAAPWLACRSPQRYTGLAAGAHTFAVRAISPLGRPDASPAHARWTTKAATPPVTKTTTPAGTTPVTTTTTTAATTTSAGSTTATTVPVTRPTTTTTTTTTPTTPITTRTTTTTTTPPPTSTTSTTTTSTTTTTTTTTPPPPATYSVAGSVTGLYGTVVLQDNGGDDLSVTGDGSFTDQFAFTTPLTTQASYDVTVATDPPGETCTVSDGTGTVESADVTSVSVTCRRASDDFNRADGGLGTGWTPMTDGGLSIASDAVEGSAVAGTVEGDIRTAESYESDQYSQIELTSQPLSDGEWVGASVRNQADSHSMYLGVYSMDATGSPQLQLWERAPSTDDKFQQLGETVDPEDPLPAGTRITVTAEGSQIALLVDGVPEISVTDTTLTSGAPGIMADGAATADNWAGGSGEPAPLDVLSRSTDSLTNATVTSYDFTSGDDGYGTHVIRVIQPTDPNPAYSHNFLYVLPVEAEVGTQFGDAIQEMLTLDAANDYNLTIIEPSFAIAPWYADDPDNANLRYESFMTDDLVPWVTQQFSTTGQEQNWLMGFSKSGIGAQDLLFKHPDVYTLAASWDFPADMSSYDQYDDSAANYGTQDNFQDNYELTQDFLDANKGPFTDADRIWIGGYSAFETNVEAYDTLLDNEGIAHDIESPLTQMNHRWDSDWVPIALNALSKDSQDLSTTP